MRSKNEITNCKARKVKTPELHDFLAHWVHRLSAGISQGFERALAESGITHAQWVILCTIYRGNADTPRTIAEYVGVDAGSVSRSVDRLVAKGLLRKQPHAADGRSITLVLTPKEVPVIENLMQIACELEMDWRGALTHAEMEVFSAMMAKMLARQGIAPTGRFWG